MLLAGMSSTDSIVQFITVLLIFVLVLALAFWTTRFVAKYQKTVGKQGNNVEVVETCPVGNGKYIQIVRIADTYVAIAVCKDTVTLLAELDREQIVLPDGKGGSSLSFKELFRKTKAAYPDQPGSADDETTKEE